MPFQTEKITQNGNTGVPNLRSPNTRKKLRFSLRFYKLTAHKLIHVSAKEYLNTVGMLGLGDFALFVLNYVFSFLCIKMFLLYCVR
jgi:hypothetical protein